MLDYQSASAADVVYSLDSISQSLEMVPGDYSQAHQVRDAEIDDFLNLHGRVLVETHGGAIAGRDQNVLWITSAKTELDFHVRLVELMIDKLDVKQAGIHDRSYHYWQNAEDPRLYESAGRDHSSLPKVQRDLPPPLDNLIVDISNNPGRVRICNGYSEFVASPMWIRDEIIRDRSALESMDGVRLAEQYGLVQVVAEFMPFTDSSDRQKYLQDRMREALYPPKSNNGGV